MTDQEYQTIQAMRERGGSFVKLLADLFAHADEDNRRRIREAWPEYWEEYSNGDLSAGVQEPAPCSTVWNTGEPPHDGHTVVIMGRITWEEEDGGGSKPILCEAHYSEGWRDNEGLSISEYYGETLHIDWWIPLPSGGIAPN